MKLFETSKNVSISLKERKLKSDKIIEKSDIITLRYNFMYYFKLIEKKNK